MIGNITAATFDETAKATSWSADVALFFDGRTPAFLGFRDMYDLSVTCAWSNWIDYWLYPGAMVELGSEAGDLLADQALAEHIRQRKAEATARYDHLSQAIA